MDNKVVEVLQCARDLITDPKHWTVGVLARDAKNRRVPSDDPNACKFCSMGAIAKCAQDRGYIGGIEQSATDVLKDVIGTPIAIFNDRPSTTHADVLYAFDQAIKRAKAFLLWA